VADKLAAPQVRKLEPDILRKAPIRRQGDDPMLDVKNLGLPVTAAALALLASATTLAGSRIAYLPVSVTVVSSCDPSERLPHRWLNPAGQSGTRETRSSLLLCANANYTVIFGHRPGTVLGADESVVTIAF
jgi:hypothetical protein